MSVCRWLFREYCVRRGYGPHERATYAREYRRKYGGTSVLYTVKMHSTEVDNAVDAESSAGLLLGFVLCVVALRARDARQLVLER